MSANFESLGLDEFQCHHSTEVAKVLIVFNHVSKSLQPVETKTGGIVVTTFRGWASWIEIAAEVHDRIAAVVGGSSDPSDPIELVSVVFGLLH